MNNRFAMENQVKLSHYRFIDHLGRNQVLLGVVPKKTPILSNQSCKSFCPLAIANCKEDRLVFLSN